MLHFTVTAHHVSSKSDSGELKDTTEHTDVRKAGRKHCCLKWPFLVVSPPQELGSIVVIITSFRDISLAQVPTLTGSTNI